MPHRPPIPFSDSQIRKLITLKLKGYGYRRIAEMFAATGFYCCFMTIARRFRTHANPSLSSRPMPCVLTQDVHWHFHSLCRGDSVLVRGIDHDERSVLVESPKYPSVLLDVPFGCLDAGVHWLKTG